MAFNGPDLRDYRNVVALNTAYLSLLGDDSVLARGLAGCREPLRQRLMNLRREEFLRLAETPFLLFSFREKDGRYWDQVLDESREPGLFRTSGSEPVDTLVSAALGFIWQLANRNPYTLRLICGTTLYWCDRIAELTFYELLDAVRNTGDVPLLRESSAAALWKKLLVDGVSANGDIRRAAQIASFQGMLTEPVSPGGVSGDWQLAAKVSSAPGLHLEGSMQSSRR